MTTEEKAKAYDEALEKAKKYHEEYWQVDAKDITETLFPQLIESKDEKIRKEINILYSDIDACITELLKARTDKDSEAEGKALFKMEGLMVATLQDLSCIEDYLEKQKEQKPAEWSEEDERLLTKLMSFVDIECFDRECNGKDVIDWLKSLRPSWKPSEEQIQALEYVVSSIPPNYLKEQKYVMTLIGQVIQQLKKLLYGSTR